MSIKLQLPTLTDLRPRLTVVGVGGAGCNAINNMIAAGLTGVDFVVANTDAQALAASSAEHRIQLGTNLTEGLGAGSRPEIGEAAAEEAIDELRAMIAGSHMVFIASGMGGGTGTGAAAVIARVAKELGILTVGIVTKPFFFEGTRRMRIADIGVAELKKYVDTLIVIPNQNLFRIANAKTTFAEAFVLADQVLYSGVACIVDLIIKEGLINLDFADVRTVMSGMGTAMMGTGEAAGERRAILAAEEAIANPLLDDVSLRGARGLLLSISGGRDLTLYEVDEAASRIREEVDPDANIIVGATFDESLGDRVRVSIVASGMLRQTEQPGRDPSFHQAPAPQQTSTPHYIAQSAPSAGPAAPQNRPAGQTPSQSPGQTTGREPNGALQLDEVQRRLSAAMHQPDPSDPFESARWVDQQPHSHPPAPAAAARDMWQAPGSVMIEDAVKTPVEPPAFPSRPNEARAPVETFTPELPTEVRRPRGRMPELEEFPAHAQREFRQRSGADRANTHDEPAPAKRLGLFDRLAGRGRRTVDQPPQAAQPQVQSPQARPNQPNAPRQRPAPQAGRSSHPATDDQDQGAELPEFFSRDRR